MKLISILYPSALTLLPSPIFSLSSPIQQYSGLSFLVALTKKLRIVFSDFQTNFPTDPSHLLKYIHLTTQEQLFVTRSLAFCTYSVNIQILLLKADIPIEVDSEIIREFILFVKEALPTILTHISNIDTLVASLPSDSSPTTPLESRIDTQMITSLKWIRDECEAFVRQGWEFLARLTFNSTSPNRTSFQTIILDDPSFPNLIFNSLHLNHQEVRRNIIITIINIIVVFPRMNERFMTVNLVGRMFETVDFVSLPLLESKTLFYLTRFISSMFDPNVENEDARFEQYRLIRVSVFEPAKHFITFMFRNSNTLILNEEDTKKLKNIICWIHHRITHMELRSHEHDADIVSELVKWEMRTMVEMENELNFGIVFNSMLDRTHEWRGFERERQKRREVVLRVEGWDDAFELRVVGMETDIDQDIQELAERFRMELTLNADRL
ncbi:hypothetical protein BLNAU_20511 [Blattamonas nauphoetae]|uniref:FPL domain-containing protein n=1 Tax=Blattamonas nauphoetae TaxID=2049346 RepID=A0ABQ9WYL9_9EUKA|nr:hypothetical protein BLNAU_20511 [Blattamonas nauphoetae]